LNKIEQKKPKDLFSIYQENVNKFFKSIRSSVPRYHQSITNVQQEFIQAYENVIDSSVALQKEYARKTGVVTNIPETAIKVIQNTVEDIAKTTSIQNQVALVTLDATQQNIKTFNDNAKSFTELNQNILNSWISAFTSKKN
jgi:rRNA maturation endonuclease Nob1